MDENRKEKLDAKEKEIKELEKEEKTMDTVSETFDLFKQEFKSLDELEDAYDDIYDQVKEHYDAIANARGLRGALTFISAQTSNLINIRSAKSNVIRDRINLKKSLLEYDFKKSLHNQDNSTAQGMATELLRAIINNEITDPTEVVDSEFHEIGRDLGEVVKELEEAGQIKYSESERDLSTKLNVDAVINDLIENEERNKLEMEEEERRRAEQEASVDLEEEEMEYPGLEEAEEEVYEETSESEEETGFPGLEEAEEIIEDAKSFSLAIGMSHDRRMWDYIAIDNETGELIETEDLPSTDGVDLKVRRQGDDLIAYLSTGDCLPIYTIEFDYNPEDL